MHNRRGRIIAVDAVGVARGVTDRRPTLANLRDEPFAAGTVNARQAEHHGVRNPGHHQLLGLEEDAVFGRRGGRWCVFVDPAAVRHVVDGGRGDQQKALRHHPGVIEGVEKIRQPVDVGRAVSLFGRGARGERHNHRVGVRGNGGMLRRQVNGLPNDLRWQHVRRAAEPHHGVTEGGQAQANLGAEVPTAGNEDGLVGRGLVRRDLVGHRRHGRGLAHRPIDSIMRSASARASTSAASTDSSDISPAL